MGYEFSDDADGRELAACRWLRLERLKHICGSIALAAGLVDTGVYVLTNDVEPCSTSVTFVSAWAMAAVWSKQGPAPDSQ